MAAPVYRSKTQELLISLSEKLVHMKKLPSASSSWMTVSVFKTCTKWFDQHRTGICHAADLQVSQISNGWRYSSIYCVTCYWSLSIMLARYTSHPNLQWFMILSCLMYHLPLNLFLHTLHNILGGDPVSGSNWLIWQIISGLLAAKYFTLQSQSNGFGV